ncbi:Patched domain-containing protein 3 [Halocaridina rubra]|uniref:Patched domain-containing protein 3 n=1 Tax=Halocaridina rubra TaxID=373956 RepID=A0AAN8XC99_HALRR
MVVSLNPEERTTTQVVQTTSQKPAVVAQSKLEYALTSCSGIIIGALEDAFYSYGKAIARSPILFILLCLVLSGFCSIGITKFAMEERPFKLWIPEDSEFLNVMDWQEKNFPSDVRLNMAIYEADNVLDKEVILEMMRIHDIVANTRTESVSWNSVCARVPTIATAFFGRKKRDVTYAENTDQQIFLKSISKDAVNEHRGIIHYVANETRFKRQIGVEEEDFDISLFLPRDRYCRFLESMVQECLENSLLEVFGYDRESLEALSQEQIIEEINLQETSAVFGFPTNFTAYLGKIEEDEEGRIIRAGAAIHRWFTKINRSAIDNGDFVIDAGTSSHVDASSFQWEQEFIKNMLNDSSRPNSVSLHLMASTSFGTVSGNNIQSDTKFLSVGFGVVFIYIILMLGRLNMVEQRPILSLLGLSCVGLAIGVSYGICSAFDVTYGPVNNILPFLLLGLGVDDMFVIMQALNNLSPDEKDKNLAERIGSTLKHAGVSITVTSVTDFLAFAIGSSTTLPALRSFCIYAAVGIASIYFFQATFFVAWLSIDQRRLEDKRHGLFWCWKIKNWSPNECSQREFCQSFFGGFYANTLLKLPVKIIIIIFTLAVLAISGWGLSNLRQEFNSIWFLPQDSYLYEFFMKQNHYFPSSGEEGTIYFGNISLSAELPKIEGLIRKLEENEYIATVDSWYDTYKTYWEKQDYQVPDPQLTEDDFLDQLSQFLYSPSGSKYRNRNFRFERELNCTDMAPPVTASSIEYKHKQLFTSKEKIKAMDSVRGVIRSMNFSGYVRSWSRAYAEWETDKVIEEELYRNMGLALVIVLIVTLILIASIATSLLVLLCVLMTLVDVGALMHWWGLTIDTVSCIDLVLAIGLCVDYAAHVGHTFMTTTGTRNERAAQTVGIIGPAVFSGGFSTFLSFVFLANSSSHVFISFFKIFFAVCLYGLYHGLVFLPVVLSFIGPDPYITAYKKPSRSESTQKSAPSEMNKGNGISNAVSNGASAVPKGNGGFIEKEITDEYVQADRKQEEIETATPRNVETEGLSTGASNDSINGSLVKIDTF